MLDPRVREDDRRNRRRLVCVVRRIAPNVLWVLMIVAGAGSDRLCYGSS